MMEGKLRGQGLSEYSICLAVILIAFLSINIYVKRGLQGRYKDAIDEAITAVSKGAPDISVRRQYEPYYVKSENAIDMSRTTSRTMGEKDAKGKLIEPGKVTRKISGQPTIVESTNVEGINVEGSTDITWK